jgi:hypothetical protein
MILRAILISVVLTWPSAKTVSAADKYLCVAEQATGFSWNGKRWIITSFRVEEKFMFQEVEPKGTIGGEYSFIVGKVGEKYNKFQCKGYQAGGIRGRRVICGGLDLWYGMIMDTESLRYQEFYGIGFIEGNDKPESGSPSITIGACTSVD